MKLVRRISFIALFIFICGQSMAQDYSRPVKEVTTQANLGLGFGLDYGGMGARFGFIPVKHIGLFLGLGYNFNDFGYNFGISHRVNTEDRGIFYYSLMYGYNAVLIVKDYSSMNKTYYGVTIGAGVELNSRKKPGNFWNFELLVPIRSSEFHSDMNSPYIDLDSEPLPVTFSVGYHFRLG